MGSRRPAVWVTALTLAIGCAHGPVASYVLEEVRWPPPPETPRVRLYALFPDPGAPAPRRTAWRVILDALAGAEPPRADSSWLQRPFGIAVSDDGSFAVADPDASSVLRVDAARTAERIECPDSPWIAPMAVAVGGDRSLFVADAGAAAVIEVNRDGRCRSLGSGAFERPTGIALDGERILVVDPPRHAVVVLSTDGTVVERWGGLGEGPGELHFPTGIARAADGTVLVVDALNFRIARFAKDGRWLGAFGAPGKVDGAFERPKALATDSGGRIYVTDAQRDLVLVFRQDGRFDYAIGSSGSDPGVFAMPAGVAVAGGRIFVADSHNRRVQVFEIL